MALRVVEDGNRRVGDMTVAEIQQCILDIRSWFERHTEQDFSSIGVASPQCKIAQLLDMSPLSKRTTALQSLQKALDVEFPKGFRELYEAGCDGGLWFLDKRQLTISEILKLTAMLTGDAHWNGSLVPFATDGDGALLVVNTSNGGVYEWQPDEGLGDLVAENLLEYLEKYRNDLLGQALEFIDDVGVVEKMGHK